MRCSTHRQHQSWCNTHMSLRPPTRVKPIPTSAKFISGGKVPRNQRPMHVHRPVALPSAEDGISLLGLEHGSCIFSPSVRSSRRLMPHPGLGVASWPKGCGVRAERSPPFHSLPPPARKFLRSPHKPYLSSNASFCCVSLKAKPRPVYRSFSPSWGRYCRGVRSMTT